MINPTPELPDDTLIDFVDLSTRIRNALKFAGLKAVGDVREDADQTLLILQDLGLVSVKHLRNAHEIPSCEGVWPVNGLDTFENVGVECISTTVAVRAQK